MLVRKIGQTVVMLALFGVLSLGESVPQTPRQAIIEMISGGEAHFKKHLTLEMQNKLREMVKDSPSGLGLFQALTPAHPNDPDRFQAFDLGPVLFSFNNPQQHERYEVQIDNEDPRGDEDIMGLSLHLVRKGMEQDMPVALRFVLNMRKQDGTWRLDALTLSANLSLGDPRLLDSSLLVPLMFAANSNPPDSKPPVVVDDRPKLSPLRAVRMIGMAESIYAQGHPGVGFTCRMSDLVNIGKGLDEDGVYKFMDAEFADGLYNGYRFTLTGCERPPARAFRLTAEPVAGKGKAYCTDNTNNLRASDDGRGVSCLIAGKLARR